MDHNLQAVGPLKKISLALSFGRSESSIDSSKSQFMEFIFGVGVGGLTHFEYALAGKHPRDEVIFMFNKNDRHHQFAHLYNCLPGFQVDTDMVFLKAAIENVTEPTHREIVRALAEAASCGSECGCGCGSH
jgi:hypothetical protein